MPNPPPLPHPSRLCCLGPFHLASKVPSGLPPANLLYFCFYLPPQGMSRSLACCFRGSLHIFPNPISLSLQAQIKLTTSENISKLQDCIKDLTNSISHHSSHDNGLQAPVYLLLLCHSLAVSIYSSAEMEISLT